MPEYTEIESTVVLNDVEYKCWLDFNYQPPEKSYFNWITGDGNDEVNEAAEIINIHVQINKDFVIELKSTEYDFLLKDNEIESDLEISCIEYIHEQQQQAFIDAA